MTRIGLRHAPAPPPRRGHYTVDGRAWFDETRETVYRLLDGADTLEIELEEAGGHTVIGSLVATLSAQQGHAWYRFIGRAHSEDPRWPEYAVIGGTFAAPRAFLGTPIPPDDAWAPDLADRLTELRAELVASGWLLAGHGEHPWSFRYTRPWVEIER